MSTIQPTFIDRLKQEQHELDSVCRRKWGISVKVFKIIKATTQFMGAAFAMWLVVEGMVDPEFALVMIGVFIGGPDYFEAYLTRDRDENT